MHGELPEGGTGPLWRDWISITAEAYPSINGLIATSCWILFETANRRTRMSIIVVELELELFLLKPIWEINGLMKGLLVWRRRWGLCLKFEVWRGKGGGLLRMMWGIGGNTAPIFISHIIYLFVFDHVTAFPSLWNQRLDAREDPVRKVVHIFTASE